jgi:hypothetical protein
MSAYKQFLASDIIVTPFEVNKGFSFNQSEWGTNVQIDRFLGTSGSFEFNQDTTGTLSTQYQVLVYNSIKELYYSNFLTQSFGDIIQTASLVPGNDEAGNVLVGPTNSTGRYFNYLQSTLTASRYFPTGSGAEVGVISVSSKLFGEYIQPDSFNYTFTSGSVHTITDDGQGNLVSASVNVGNIIYPHGMVIITDAALASGSAVTTNATCSFSSSLTIYETQYKCTIRENEFNFSLNPSLISGSTDGTVYGYVTSSYFNPYVSTVGLYDEFQNLLAVGKLAQPLPTSATTDTTILINLDR